MVIEKVGRDETLGRDLYVLHIPDVHHLPPVISLGAPFVCLLAWDASTATDGQLATVATKLIGAGCVYACSWGPDCERVHDAIDLVSSIASATEGRDAFVMTSWHSGEPLAEAIWFVLQCTPPHDAHMADCHATLAISIGTPGWAAQIRSAFADPIRFLPRAGDDR